MPLVPLAQRIGRWPRRVIAATAALSSGWVAWRCSNSTAIAIATSGGLLLSGSMILQWRALRLTRARWQAASEVVSLVLQSLKSEAREPQRHSTATNLALLYRVQQPDAASVQPVAACDVAPVAPARLREAQRYMRFATAAYGHALMATFGYGCARAPSASALLKGADAIDLEALCRHCHVEEADVVAMRQGDEGAGCPGYFIAVDRARSTIVLSVRGTASIFDAVVHDLVCVAEPFPGGVAHAGMAHAAYALRTAAIPMLAELAAEHRSYRLLLTGHSMGGGVAALLAVLIHYERNPTLQGAHVPPPPSAGATATAAETQTAAAESLGSAEPTVVVNAEPAARLPLETSVACITFASPPVYAPLGVLDSGLTQMISAYVHHADVVPSLSLATVRTLLASLRALDATPLPPRRRLAIITGREPPPPEMLEALQVACSPGKVPAPTLSVPSQDVVTLARLGAHRYDASSCSVDTFAARAIRLAPSMVTDHSFGFYQHAIDCAVLAVGGDSQHGDGGSAAGDDHEAKAV